MYGSVARGTQTEESDIDIAVMLRSKENDDMKEDGVFYGRQHKVPMRFELKKVFIYLGKEWSNDVYDNTLEPVRIIRKHKEDISIFPNELWSEEKIFALLEDIEE